MVALWNSRIVKQSRDLSYPDHPMRPQPSYPAPQGWLSTPSTPLSCGMASCWQINSILANNGRKNSIQILNRHPFFMKSINLSIVYWFHKVFIILKN